MRTEESDLAIESESEPEPESEPVLVDAAAPAESPVVVLRMHRWLRFVGLGLVVGGLAAGALEVTPAFGIAALGLGVCLTWVPRLELDAHQLRVRRLRGSVTVPIDDIDEVRLRRVPIGRLRPVHRSYRIGRFCTTPLRLRVMHAQEPLVQLTVVAWARWPVLVRYLLSRPDVASDSRTRGRLDRYG